MRRSLEALLDDLPCPKARPSFLRNPATKRCLELDAWCEERKVAGEFQGAQHSEYPNPVHKSRTAFEAQVKRDALKQELCAAHAVRLILVPHTVTREEMSSHLERRLRELGILAESPPGAAAATPAGAVQSQTSDAHDQNEKEIEQTVCH